MKKKCKKCGKKYTLGVAGTFKGCDKCLGITRDKHGYAWDPGEKTMLLMSIRTGKVKRVKRPRKS